MAIDRHSTKGRLAAGANRAFMATQRSLYRLSGGRIAGKTAGVPVLLLTVTGRRTGKRRTIPLIYWSRDGEYVVSASAGGNWLPMWYRNLQSNPAVDVQIGRDKFSTTARLADAEESRELWAVTESLNPRFREYPGKLPHEIPMVVLPRT